MVFYRKYRPQNINELDSKAVRDALTSVMSQIEPPHAFLFTGPKGLGKTSTARIVAKVINCERPKQKGKDKAFIEPCNECTQCLSITNGTHIDITEIDGASNRNIDDVRDLKEKIKLSPASAKKKVYIIDEVHMFTTESFNALLKTLEEPPAHAMFILCTTERHKVPATIVSRCFTIDFMPATKDELVRSFKRIAQGENVQIEDDVLYEIAKLADGGFRDGAKILEELVSATQGKAVTKATIEDRYKVSGIKSKITDCIISLQENNAKEALQIIQEVVKEGIDSRQFTIKLLEQLHAILLSKSGITVEDTNIDLITLDQVDLKFLLQIISMAYNDMKFAVLPQLPLELAILEWCQRDMVQSTERVEVSREGANISVAVKTGKQVVNIASMRKQVGDIARVKALYGEPKAPSKIPNDGVSTTSINLFQVSNDAITPEWLNHFWNSLILEVKQHNHTIAGVLRGCTLYSFDNKMLILDTAYKFHKERLDVGKTKEMLASICKTLTGNNIVVEVRLKS